MFEISFTSDDWIGIVLGFAFVFSVLGVSEVLRRRLKLDAFVTRKLVHISVAHWWLIAWYFHDTLAPALVGPVVFTVLNYLDYRRQVLPGLQKDQAGGDYGTVIFPIALIILCLVTFGGPFPVYAGAVGILVLGYGDGLAALLGRRFGKTEARVFGSTKTVVGSAVMCVAASAVVFVITWTSSGASSASLVSAIAVSVAVVATAIELCTPWNLDNVTVPIGTLLVYVFALHVGGFV